MDSQITARVAPWPAMHMTSYFARLSWASLLAFTALVSPFSVRAAGSAAKPNIVFILMDDFGWADLGCYGSKFYRTPNVDRLAAEGMRFTDAYAACPVCSPTRASIMTGKYPARLQLTDWLPGRKDMPNQRLLRPEIQQQLALSETTIAEALKRAGYVSAAIGKWHLGGKGFEPEAQGFAVNIGGNHAGSPPTYFHPYKNKANQIPGLEQGTEGEYLTDRLTTEAEKFIEQSKDKPFFLYFAHYAVHIPLMAKQELIAKYQGAVKSGQLQTNAVYAAMVESMDESVGRIMRKLDELRLAENTVVFFTSDNGGLATLEGPFTPATSNAPLREGKGFLYEGGIREPLIVRWPGVIKAGSVVSTPVSSVDYFPTIVEMAGLKAEAALDGMSLAALLKGGAAPKRDALFWHYPHYANQGGKPGGAIRMGDFKLIEFYETGRLELYNVKEDIREANNLAEKNPAKAAQMEARLDAWRRDVKAQMMLPNPEYRPTAQAADGTVVLAAKDADIHGTMVRYEPVPHRNTIGFWVNVEDWVSWDFLITKPGRYKLEILQGCGTGNGGSEVEFSVGEQVLKTTVVDTGGFQNFQAREIGTLKFEKPDRYTLTVKPKTKAKQAVMDLRSVTLKP